jgi:hypothetical protein
MRTESSLGRRNGGQTLDLTIPTSGHCLEVGFREALLERAQWERVDCYAGDQMSGLEIGS